MGKRDTQPVTRRAFVKKSGTVLVSLVASGSAVEAIAGSKSGQDVTRRLGMVIDLDRCIGCQACAVACKAENGVRLGAFRSWVSEKESGTYPNVTRYFLPRLCNQCDNPPCLTVCPTGATHRRADGIVEIDRDRCIGCRHCMGACPYNARYFNDGCDPEGEQFFPSRTHGTVDKCNFCAHRVDRGIVPSCVNTCPTGARVFGDLADPDSEVSRLSAGKGATPLLVRFGTEPSVRYAGGSPHLFEA